MNYLSTVRRESQSHPSVWYAIKKLSLAGRLELLRVVRREGRELEFHGASEALEDQLRAREITASIEAIYLRWGLAQIEGLTIDGEPATAETLIEKGPEGLCNEIAEAIRKECFLSEEERKN
jgi:hypothetical protein